MRRQGFADGIGHRFGYGDHRGTAHGQRDAHQRRLPRQRRENRVGVTHERVRQRDDGRKINDHQRKRSRYASQSQADRNFSAATYPFAYNSSISLSEMSKSRKPTSVESTRIARALTQGSLRWAFSRPTRAVVMTPSRRCGAPSMRRGASAGITLSLPSGRFGNTVTPKLGQRGFRPSGRSSESIGKLERIPPSTNVEVKPVEPRSVTGRKKNGIAIDARTASATDCSSGSRP